VIVNYNGWDDVLRLVSVLARAPEVVAGTCDVVVVDNASDGTIPPEFAMPEPGVRLIVRRENGGFAAGVNAGWRTSQSPWLLVLNPDVAPCSDLLGRVLERIERFTNRPAPPGIVGFGLRNADGSRQPSVGAFPSLARSLWGQLIPRNRRKYQAGWRTRSGQVPWVTGACVLLNARMMEQLGGMDEDFFLYYEEVALCHAAQRLGWRVEYDPSVEVVHLRPLQNRRLTPEMRVITRHSKLLYFRKHLPRWQFQSLARIVAGEARLRGLWASLWRRTFELRAWRLIGRLARAMRLGSRLGGPSVRMLAESVAQPEQPILSDGQIPAQRAARPLPALPGRGPHLNRRVQLRKDGPECH